MRTAKTFAEPIVISLAVENFIDLLLTSVSEADSNTLRDRGPTIFRTAFPEVTSKM